MRLLNNPHYKHTLYMANILNLAQLVYMKVVVVIHNWRPSLSAENRILR